MDVKRRPSSDGSAAEEQAAPAPVNDQKDPRLLIVMNNPVRRQCLEFMLRAVLTDCSVESVPLSEGILAERPNCVLLGISPCINFGAHMRAEVAKIKDRFADCPVIVMSDEDDLAVANDAIRFGVSGFLTSNTTLDTFIAAIRLAMAGAVYVPIDLISLWTADSRPAEQGEVIVVEEPASARVLNTGVFTSRELDVVERLQSGQPNKLIAYELHMSESTVKVHLRNIMRKLGATNRTQVAFITRGGPTVERTSTGPKPRISAPQVSVDNVRRPAEISAISYPMDHRSNGVIHLRNCQ